MAEKDLEKLLSGINPALSNHRYYFASVGESELMALANFLDSIIAIFREDEGITVVFLDEIKDDIGQITEKITGPFALITIGADSDLLAVGFLAKISAALAGEKISVNAFSAYHHDHLFVPFERKDDAMSALNRLKAD
jgi:hypothetical protein